MRLVNSICILITKLIKNSSDSVVVLGCNEFTNDTFEPEIVVSGSSAASGGQKSGLGDRL